MFKYKIKKINEYGERIILEGKGEYLSVIIMVYKNVISKNPDYRYSITITSGY